MTDDQFNTLMLQIDNIVLLIEKQSYYNQMYLGILFGGIIAIILVVAFKGIR